MQVHEHAGGAPTLAALRHNRGGKRMQFDAIAHAGLKMAENREETHKNWHSGCQFFHVTEGGHNSRLAHNVKQEETIYL